MLVEGLLRASFFLHRFPSLSQEPSQHGFTFFPSICNPPPTCYMLLNHSQSRAEGCKMLLACFPLCPSGAHSTFSCLIN